MFLSTYKKKKLLNWEKKPTLVLIKLSSLKKRRKISFPITIFNSDGGEVSACGNGSRCVAYLLSKNLDDSEIKFKLTTDY